jgi:hypothetical protein
MDSISSYEFHKIFVRVCGFIDFKGKFTVEEIEEELTKAGEKCKRLRRKAETAEERAKLKRAAISYGHLLEYGFAERAMHEASANPKGIVGMTLKYSYKEAKRKILAQKRARIRMKLRRR